MVKATDLMTAIGKLIVAYLILLLIAAIGEHWLVPGGYGTNERMAFWAIAVIGGGVYFARNIFPLLLQPVNALYAADELEREAPDLKNSLVNLLQLREDEHTTQTVKKTIERQAAQRLAGAKPQGVDQSSLIHVGYALLAVMAVTAAYIVLSPKDFFTTAGRVISPWSELAAPSRVKIEDMTPGDTTLAQGEQLEVSLSILGMQEDEQAEIIYSSDDGRIVERRLSLIPSSESSIGYSIQIPGNSEPLGLQSSISYRIEAGDARTRNYQAEVLTTPAIAPVSIHLDYPEYTGLEDRHVDQGGDLRGIEGTKVSLTAEANLDIETAQIDFDADGRPDIRMQVDGKQASAKFTLKRRNQAKGIASYVSSYVIRYTTKDGQTNSSPPKYPLEVFADLPPETDILEPEQEELTIGLDERLPIKIEARDPDFALKEVWLIAQKNGRTIVREQLLKPSGGGHQGRFVEEYRWVAREIGLQGGERVDYWIEALDVRNPSPQRASSRRQVFLIRPDKNPDEDNQSQEDQSGEGGNQGSENGNPSEGESGSEQNDQPNESENGGQSDNGDQSDEGEQSDQNNNGQNGDGQEGDASEPQPNEGEQGSEGSNENAKGLQEDGDPNSDTENESDSGGGAQSNNDQQRERDGNQGSGEGNREGDPNSNGQETDGGQGGGNQEQVQSDDSPVADDGSDDGAAFDRIQEHLAKKQDREPGDRPRPEVESDPNQHDDPSEEQPGDQSPDQQEGDGQNAADPESGEEGQGKPRNETGEDPDREPNNSEGDSESGQGKSSDSQSSESTESAPPGRDSKPNDDPREGTGSSGENQAADDGTGQAGDRGEGESSGRDGNQQTGETDNPSEKTEGEGNDTREGNGDRNGSGAKPNDEEQQNGEGNSEGASPSGNNSADDQPRESDNGELSEQDPNREGNPSGPRRGGDRQPFDPNKEYASEGELGEDKANLEYARKQTELVLNELEDQIQNNEVDQELLDKLGWSEEDLRQFVERWQARKQKAQKNPGKGNQELDDALRSLGLQQKNRRVTGPNNNKTDSMRDLQQGNRTTIPPALRDKLKRYNRGVNSSAD